MKKYDPSNLAKVDVVAGVVIVKDGKILLVQESWEKVRGKWNLPAGKVDMGETIEQAAVREAKEETGLDVQLKKHVFTLHQSIEDSVLHSYLAEIKSGEIKFDPEEILDVKWFEIDEVINNLDLRNTEYIVGSVNAVTKGSI